MEREEQIENGGVGGGRVGGNGEWMRRRKLK